jgi:catechol 2,3-dioxygenase-like lactoylglutathione lyase family enzyme
MGRQMFTHFDHITIATRTLDEAVDHYERLLGRAPVWLGEHPGLGTRAALFELSNSLVELVSPAGDGPESEGLRELLARRGDGLSAIAFGTDDASRTSAELRQRGVRATLPERGEARSLGGEQREYEAVEISSRSTRGLPVFAVQRPDGAASWTARAALDAHADALDHVVIRTSDPDAAIALYERGLGLRLALDRTFGSVRMLFFRIGGVTVEVVQDSGLEQTDVFYGVCYRVRDIHAAHARLVQAGLPLSEVREGKKPGTHVFTVKRGTCGVPTLFIRDPARD